MSDERREHKLTAALTQLLSRKQVPAIMHAIGITH